MDFSQVWEHILEWLPEVFLGISVAVSTMLGKRNPDKAKAARQARKEKKAAKALAKAQKAVADVEKEKEV